MPPVEPRILIINPGSTSTKIAVFSGDHCDLARTIPHSDAEMARYRARPVLDQIEFRRAKIEEELGSAGVDLTRFDAVAGRGGLIRPMPGGTWRVNGVMLEDLRKARMGEHAANLGAYLAQEFARLSGAPAFIVDPVSTDELAGIARISGTALVERRSLTHALNTKAVARRYARECGKPYAGLRLIVAHLGSGISISTHSGGRMIDVNLGGQEGPFSTERCGGLQLLDIVELCYSGRFTRDELWKALIREGGIFSYLGTKDLREVECRIASGDARAALIYNAMVYQVAKEIGGMATVLDGKVDAILITGGMAYSEKLIVTLRPGIAWIAPVVVYPGEDEMQALAEGALRVLRGEEQPQELA
jgi:butyrate kinase